MRANIIYALSLKLSNAFQPRKEEAILVATGKQVSLPAPPPSQSPASRTPSRGPLPRRNRPSPASHFHLGPALQLWMLRAPTLRWRVSCTHLFLALAYGIDDGLSYEYEWTALNCHKCPFLQRQFVLFGSQKKGWILVGETSKNLVIFSLLLSQMSIFIRRKKHSMQAFRWN